MKGPAFVASLLVLYTATTAVTATQVQGQGSAALAFEVASVKPSNPDASNPLSALPLILPSGAGRITASNTPLKNLVLGAYELQDFQLSGGPSWLTSRKCKTALQEQLGLKLENERAPGQVLVIDSAEFPTPD